MLFIDQVGDMDIVGLAQRAADGIELAFAAGFDVFLPAVDGATESVIHPKNATLRANARALARNASKT